MARKQTNLSVAADVETADDMLALADAVGSHVAVLKTHVDVFSTWTEEHAAKLRQLADKHGTFFFLLFFLNTVVYYIGALNKSVPAVSILTQ
jgi:uridine monophosphate synthetase